MKKILARGPCILKPIEIAYSLRQHFCLDKLIPRGKTETYKD